MDVEQNFKVRLGIPFNYSRSEVLWPLIENGEDPGVAKIVNLEIY